MLPLAFISNVPIGNTVHKDTRLLKEHRNQLPYSGDAWNEGEKAPKSTNGGDWQEPTSEPRACLSRQLKAGPTRTLNSVYAWQLSEDTISSVGEKAKKAGSKGEGTRLSCSRATIQARKMPKPEGCWLWQRMLAGGAKQPLPTCRRSAPSAHSEQKSCLGLTPKLTNYTTETRTAAAEIQNSFPHHMTRWKHIFGVSSERSELADVHLSWTSSHLLSPPTRGQAPGHWQTPKLVYDNHLSPQAAQRTNTQHSKFVSKTLGRRCLWRVWEAACRTFQVQIIAQRGWLVARYKLPRYSTAVIKALSFFPL